MATSIPGTENEDDPLVARLTAETQAREAKLTGSLHQAIGTNPEQYAGQRRVAEQLGYPDAVIEARPDLAQQAQVQQITKTVASSPILKQKLADDAAFAKLSHDDTANLSALEKTVNFAKALGNDAVAGLSGFNEGVYGAVQSAADVGSAVTGGILPIDLFGGLSDVVSKRRGVEKGIKSAIQKARGDMGSTEQAFHSGIESATQSLLTLPLAIMSRNPNVMSGTMAVQTGGQSYGEARDQGKSLGQALPFAVSQGTIEYATEQIPAIKLLDGLKTKAPVLQIAKDFLAKEIPGEQVATVLQDLNEWAVLNPEKPFSAYLAERPEAAYQTAVATLVGGSVQVGAAKAIDSVASHFAGQDQAAQQAQQHRDALTQLDKLSSESLLRARDPATFQQFIASAAQDGPVQDVYIDANVLAQSGVADQLAQVSPSVREQFNEAASTGGSVRIPLDEYTANIAGTQLSQGIVDHIKLDPNGMTFAESEHFQQTYQEEFNKQVDQTIAAQAGDENFKEAANEVKGLVKDQLNTAGHTSPSVNDTYASMASAYYAVRAAQLGVSPKALYEQNPLTVSGARMASDSLDQANAQIETPEFKTWFADSKVVDAEGKPQVVYHGTDKPFTKVNMKKGAQGVFWVTSNKQAIEDGAIGAAGTGTIMSLYANIKNPAGWKEYDQLSLDEIEHRGFDGVVLPNKDGTFEAIIFDPKQVKSATKNNGNFDPNDAHLLRQQAVNPASVLFEVAPDPNNSELTRAWDALTVDQKFEVSRNVAKIIVPEVLSDLKTSGTVVEQIGGYLDATNPSLAVGIADAGKVLKAAKILGEVLSQDSMIAYSDTPQKGLKKTGVITVTLPAGLDADGIHSVYSHLRAIEVDGEKLIGGHSTADGQMVLYNFSKVSDEEFKALVKDQLASYQGDVAFGVHADFTYLAFPQNGKDYDYGNSDRPRNARQAAGQPSAESVRRTDLRLRASELIRDGIAGATSNDTGRGSTGRAAGQESFAQSLRPLQRNQPLTNLPSSSLGPLQSVRDLAARYVTEAGLPFYPQTDFVIASPERGARIADAFDAMPHNPSDPAVQEAYAALIKETLAQYQAIKTLGLKIEFIKHGDPDPYSEGPKQVIADIHAGHLWVFPTTSGFGSSDLDVADNPLLAPTDEVIGDHKLVANDVFRIVHDVFGHAKEGVGFGATGEENAWQAHVRMFSPLAARAMTTETRGQNSWVNFGPYGEQNRTDQQNTTYADQKVGLLPEWVSTEGLNVGSFSQGEGINRGAYSPSENTITLLKNADLSTFLHELGHAFLSMDSQLAAQVLARGATTDGEKQILADMKTLLDWFGIEGELPEQLAAWNAMPVEEQRASHEKMAEAFEAYLVEGKAPSLDLQPIFQRFRAWLTNVYRNLSKYLSDAGETLTPEVRAVFDGMLATADQIKTAQQARGIAPLFQSADEAGMTPEEFAKYQQDSVTSSQDAISALEARSLKDMTWTSRLKERTVARLNKEALAIRKEVRKQVEAEIDQEPVYSAMRFLKRGETTGPNGEQIKAEAGHRLSIAGLEELYPAGELSNHPDWKRLGYGGFGMLSADGLHPDLVAQMFGFASGDDLVRTILDAQPRNMVVDAVTDQRMLEQHGELSSPDAISKAADEVIHNDVRTRVIATELAGLQKVLGSALALSRMAKDYARQVVGKTKVKDLRPNKFASDAAKAGKLADAAMRKGNREEAVTQKRNQLVNHTTTKAAYEAAAEVKKIVAQFRKIATAKTDTLKTTHNLDLVNAARAVLAEYGVGARAQNAREYIDLVKAYDPELYAALEPDIMMAQQNAKEIKELTIDELRALRDQVESLWYLARREQQVEINGKMMAREEVVNQLSERLDALGMPLTVPGEGKAVTEADKRKRSIQGLRASLRRVEHWVGRMDSGNYRGVFRNFIFTPISEAADRYRTDATKHIAKFRDLLKSIESSLRPGRIAAPELKYTFGHSKGDAGMAELLHAILHTGNESNKRKLLLGRGWATELEDKSLDTTKWDSFVKRMIDEGRLNKSHFDFAQGVWDLLEETKPLAQKTHREVFGRYFAEVTADSFTNQFGTFRGGYVPAITDTFEVQDAAINAAMEEANAGNAYMFPATSRGFTKSRVEYNRPLALDLRLLPAHLDKVLLFAHMERHVRDVQRVLRKMQGKLNRYDPVAYTDLLLPWLNRAAKQIVMTPSAGTAGRAMDKFLSTMRSRAGMATMFANLTNALQQITGFSITLLKVQPTHLRQAMALYIKSPGDMAKAAAALSPFMAERLDGQTFHLKGEIEDMLLNPDKYDQVKNWTQKHAYVLQSMFQNVVDTVSWTAAYNQSLAKGASEADAVRDANAAVRETQGSLQPEDISAFEAGSAWKRAFTQFASYFNMQANVMGTEFATIAQEMGFRKGAGKAFYVFLFGFLVPCWVSEAIVRGMKGGGGDGDDEYLDEWLSFIFGAPLRNATAMVPIAGPIANRAAAGFTPQQYDDRMATAPAISALESAANAPASIYKAMFEDGRIKPAIKDSLTLVSMITGVPVNVLGKPLGYMADVSQGKVIPTSTADAARGLVSGVASPDSKR
jgi:hypothetical protein